MAYDIGPRIYIDGEKEFRNQIYSINTALRTTKEEMNAVSSSFDKNENSQEALVAKGRVLTRQVEQQREKLALLEKGLKSSADKYGENDSKTQKWQQTVYRATAELNRLESELRENESALEQMGDSAKDAGTDVEKLGKSAEEAKEDINRLSGELKDKFVGGVKAVGTAVAAGTATVVGLVEGTSELRGDLSKLEANAKSAGVGFDEANDALLHFNAITGETDSSIEAISNLLMTGFTGNNLAEAVEELSGAVVRFPDTLKIESLADSLQETLATSKATGQYAELLERLGYNLDEFDNGLAKCTTSVDKQRYALKYLADAGLRDANSEYVKNNKVVIENSKAQLRLQESLAEIGQKLAPLVTKGMNKLADAASDFADGPLDALVDAGEWAIDNGEEIISVITGIGTGILAYKAIKGVSDIVTTFVDLKNAIAAATVAQEALNVAQLANPIALVGAAVVGTTAALAMYCATAGDAESENARLAESYKKNEEAIQSLDEKVTESSRASTEHIRSAGAEADAARRLASELQELAGKEGKTAVEKQRIKNIVDKLNETVPELNLNYDEQADRLNRTSSEIKDYIKNFEKTAKLQAAQEDLTEAFENQYEATKLVADITAQYNEAVEKAEEAERIHADALKLSNKEIAEQGINVAVLREERDLARRSVEEYGEQLREANETLEAANGEYEKVTEWVAQYTEATNTAAEATGNINLAQVTWKDTVIETTPELAENFELVKQKYEETRVAAEESIHQQVGLFDEINTKCDMTVADMAEALTKQAQDLNNWAKNLDIAARKGLDEGLLKQLAEAGPESAGYLAVIANATNEEIDNMNTAWQSRYAAEKYASEEMAGATTGVKNELKKLTDFTMREKQNYYQSGVNSMKGYAQGASDESGTVFGKIKWIAQQALATFNAALGINSPSREFMASGHFSGEGYLIGWENEMKDVESRMAKSIPTSFDIEYGFKTSRNYTNGYEYGMLVSAFSDAMKKANLTVVVNRREFGRLVNEVI